MTKACAGRIGISLNVTADDSHLGDAAEIEALGYSTIWLPGGQIDSLERLAELVRATTTIQIASGIIPLDVYEPSAVTALFEDLEQQFPGRLLVGLGGPQQPRPLSGLSAYLDELDAADPAIAPGRRILAALGPRKLEIARDRTGGAITLLVTPEHTRQTRAILGDRPALIVDQLVVLDSDAARARETARGPLGFLSGVKGYTDNFARMGFSGAEIETLDDRLVDRLVAWGDEDAIAARVAEQWDAGADQVVLGVTNADGQPGPIEVARALAKRLTQ
ncbi:MAG TPA: TIGR03620 family F420-dependent LLM class oxidoreductase [Frankiaceae bacterium]|jgi:probable F420-dependent oxidoreductase|nr:TIGR03620 family F420-dependent LLM class oxidoreductase [Frankiaceae bacterium]